MTHKTQTVEEIKDTLLQKVAIHLAGSGLFKDRGEILQSHIDWLADELKDTLHSYTEQREKEVREEIERICRKRTLKIGENKYAVKQLGISMEEIKLHNAFVDGEDSVKSEILQFTTPPITSNQE